MPVIIALFFPVFEVCAQPMTMNEQGNGGRQQRFLRMMDTMMERMAGVPRSSTVDKSFLEEMIPHHAGAVSMAFYEVQNGGNFEIRQLAQSILAEQRIEIEQMRLLANVAMNRPREGAAGAGSGRLTAGYRQLSDRSMSRMMTALSLSEIPLDVDSSFAAVMLPHHIAGVEMAKAVISYGSDAGVRCFAKGLISNEEVEIEQMRRFLGPRLYVHDRVYTANQVSNSVSVIDPSTNRFMGEIQLGSPFPVILSPLYKGEVLVHGLRYSAARKMLAAVAIGSNSVTLISTETNKVLKTIYVGRAPHEPTFTPDSRQIWTSVRGEAYISVIDVDKGIEVWRVPVADGPGMVTFSADGKKAYVCSSFTPELDIVDTKSYEVVKRIPVVSPFSPNIFTSPDGEWIAMTHKDVGKVTVLRTSDDSVIKVISTGALTNHVTFFRRKGALVMAATVGGENKVRIFDVAQGFLQMDSIAVGVLPHGLWASPDGERLYIGLEFADEVQAVDLTARKVMATIRIGQSPQALVYAEEAVSEAGGTTGLVSNAETPRTVVTELAAPANASKGRGRLSIRPIGMTELIEQVFNGLDPGVSYTLFLSRSEREPFSDDYEVNSFVADKSGKYSGQSTGLTKETAPGEGEYRHILLKEAKSGKTVLVDSGD
jgi:YVTN family beta-propeller protein